MRGKFLFISILGASSLHAQVGIGTEVIDPSAFIEIKSSDKGVVIPQLTNSQRANISSPANGLLVYNTELGCMESYNATDGTWFNYCCAAKVAANFPSTLTKFLYIDASEATSVIDFSGTNAAQTGFNSNNVEQLSDLSGNDRHLKTTSTNLIEYISIPQSSYYSEIYIASNASSNGDLEYELTGAENFDDQDFDLNIVAGFPSATAVANAVFFSSYDSTIDGSFQIGQGSSSAACDNTSGDGEGKYVFRYSESGSFYEVCGPATDDKLHLFRVTLEANPDGNTGTNDGVFTIYIDGEQIATAPASNGSRFNRLRFFRNRAGGVTSLANIQEVAFYDNILSESDQGAQTEYLTCKWGVQN